VIVEYGVGKDIAGGTHRTYTNRGEGFWLNDQAIGRYLAKKIGSQNFDSSWALHQEQVPRFANDASVFTFFHAWC
jgi:hypothetical protein